MTQRTKPGSDLATRVADRAQQAGADVATQQQSPFARMTNFLEQMKPEMARVLPKTMAPDRIARLALTEMRRIPMLAEATLESFGGALMTAVQLGLEPGVAGECWILPFRNQRSNRVDAQFVMGYQGMIKLFWQHPSAQMIDAHEVFPEDEFDYAYGLDPYLKHKPKPRAETSKAHSFYAVARTTTGGSVFVVLTRDDVERIRKRSKAKDNGPWVTDYDQMAKKTCIRQLFKVVPKSTQLALAIAHDETVRTDITHDLESIPPAYAAELDPPRDGDVADTTQGDDVAAAVDDGGEWVDPPQNEQPADEFVSRTPEEQWARLEEQRARLEAAWAADHDAARGDG